MGGGTRIFGDGFRRVCVDTTRPRPLPVIMGQFVPFTEKREEEVIGIVAAQAEGGGYARTYIDATDPIVFS